MTAGRSRNVLSKEVGRAFLLFWAWWLSALIMEGLPISTADKTDTSVSHAAAISLRNLAPAAKQAVPGLVKALKGDDIGLRGLAIGALGEIGPDAKDAVPDLLEAYQVKGVADKKMALTIRQASIWALGLIGPGAKSAVPVLREALNDPEATIRTEAEKSLKKIEPGLLRGESF